VRVTHIDKSRAPRFTYEFHCVIDGIRTGYHCTVALADAATCDEWMQLMLEDLKLRD
jgi:hypothetical protein